MALTLTKEEEKLILERRAKEAEGKIKDDYHNLVATLVARWFRYERGCGESVSFSTFVDFFEEDDSLQAPPGNLSVTYKHVEAIAERIGQLNVPGQKKTNQERV